MSASASKKKRKELDAQGLLPNQVAAQKEKEKKAKTVKTVVISAVAVITALAILIGVGLALKANNYKPGYDVSTPAASVGGYEVPVPIYNYFYNETASLYANYGFITANTALADQQCSFDSSQTWEGYLKTAALDSVKSVYTVYDAAVKAGYELTEDDKTAIADGLKAMKDAAKSRGYSNVNYFLADVMGRGCNATSYEEYLMLRQYASGFSAKMNDDLQPTAEEIDAELAENGNNYRTVYYKTASVKAENSAEEGEDAVYTDEAKAEAKAQADAKAAAFSEDDAISRNGGYDTVKQSYGEEVADWLFDSARKDGDTMVSASEDEVTYTVVQFNKIDNNEYNRVVGTVLRLAYDNAEGVTDSADAYAAIQKGLKNGMSEEDFNTLLSDNNQSASETAVDRNSYTDAVISWLYDAARAEGDVTAFEDAEAGYYYVLRYCETQELDYAHTQAKSTLGNASYSDWYGEVTGSMTAKLLPGVGYANTNLTFYSNSSAE